MDLPVVEVGQLHPDLLRGKTEVLQPFPDHLGLKEFFQLLKIDGLVKSLLGRHPGESRGPEHVEINGFRLSPEWRILRNCDFLRVHQDRRADPPGIKR